MIAVTDLHANVDWPALISALESGATYSAIAALNVDAAAFGAYSQAVTAAFLESGTATATLIRQSGIAGVGIRFDATNPRAERWIRENVAASIVGFVEEQVQTARTVIEAGYAAGSHPHTIARDLSGRVGNSGVREGGVLGLDGPRADRLHKVSLGMRTQEGVQDLVVRRRDGTLAVRYKVNKSTEARILSAYRNESAVPEKQRIISERQYSNALLRDRAETVAETETADAVMNARDESWRQAAESQGMDEGAIRKTWRHRRGGDGRPAHIAMAGVSVMGLETPFILPTGELMLYPHDPAGGAKNNIRCACSAEYSLQRQVS